MKLLLLLAALVAVSLYGLKRAFPLPERNFAVADRRLPPAWTGALGQAIAPGLQRHPGLNGILPLADGRAAFAARAILAREAVASIDAQYYIWQDDTTGLMLLEELRAAAERGVRVRLLLDDNGVPGLDAFMAELDALPFAEVRIWNPFTLRRPKLLSYAFDFRRLNRRMHNKSMTVDGVATIVGGRNVGDIYFEYGAGTHYFDVDAVAIGPIVDQVAATFDAYWNSGSAYAANRILPAAGPPRIAAAAAKSRASADGAAYQRAIEEHTLTRNIAARDVPLEWGATVLYADDPKKGLGHVAGDELVVEKLFALVGEVHTSLDLVSAYFIPGARGTRVLQDLARRGVGVRVLTNSLDATDVVPVHAAYRKYRAPLLDAGVQLLELRAMRKERVGRTLPDLLAGSASGLHAKTFGFDGKRVFIGSYNLDPRSARLNTEMGLLVESPSIAASLSRTLDDPTIAYAVRDDGRPGLVWTETAADGTKTAFTSEPKAGPGKRAMAEIFAWLPIEWML